MRKESLSWSPLKLPGFQPMKSSKDPYEMLLKLPRNEKGVHFSHWFFSLIVASEVNEVRAVRFKTVHKECLIQHNPWAFNSVHIVH